MHTVASWIMGDDDTGTAGAGAAADRVAAGGAQLPLAHSKKVNTSNLSQSIVTASAASVDDGGESCDENRDSHGKAE